MDYNLITNTLSGLLILTSLLVVIAKNTRVAAILYAFQSVALVLILFSLGELTHAEELFTWGFSAIITKVILVPLIIYKALGNTADIKAKGTVISPGIVLAVGSLFSLFCYFLVSHVSLPFITKYGLEPVFAVSLGHFLIGVFCIIVQRNILNQVFGYCLMENGSHLTLALLANQAPHLVEVGISTDAIFAVIIMVYMVRRIHTKMQTLSVKDLTALKG